LATQLKNEVEQSDIIQIYKNKRTE